jgi:hypothetical protein
LRDDFIRGHMHPYPRQQLQTTAAAASSRTRTAVNVVSSPPPRQPTGAQMTNQITSPTSSQQSFPVVQGGSRSRQSSIPPPLRQDQYPPLYDTPSRTTTPAKEAPMYRTSTAAALTDRPPPSMPRQQSHDSLDDAIENGLSRVASTLTANGHNRNPSVPPGSVMDFHGIPIPVPAALVGGAANHSSTSGRLSATRSPAAQLPFHQQRASRFLMAVVEAVALRKQARLVPLIPIEVIVAFDSVVRDGAYFVKYTSGSAPHERFFQIRFVDVQGRSPEPCISWSVHRTSWSAKGILNLAAVRRVTRGVGTKAFRRQQVDDRRIRGPMIGGPHRAVLPTTHAFFIDLVDGVSAPGDLEEDGGTTEPLSLLSLNSEVFEAWLTFLNFVISIGTADDEGSYEDDGRGSSRSHGGTPHSS